jgi:hypothetical protein
VSDLINTASDIPSTYQGQLINHVNLVSRDELEWVALGLLTRVGATRLLRIYRWLSHSSPHEITAAARVPYCHGAKLGCHTGTVVLVQYGTVVSAAAAECKAECLVFGDHAIVTSILSFFGWLSFAPRS